MKIVVLAGGLSPEREVSLSSGGLIANSLIRSGHSVLLVDLYLGVELEDAVFKTGGDYGYSISEGEPELSEVIRKNGGRTDMVGKNVLEVCRMADIVFIALHGSVGENGQLQAMLDMYGIKYTGTGYAGSLLAMNKHLSKRLMRADGIKTADWILYNTAVDKPEHILSEVGLPCVVKPCSGGSSIGTSLVRSNPELAAALAAAEKYEKEIIVEKLISGREFSCGVLCGKALPSIEIIPKTNFYDYKNKYQSGMTVEVCPSELSPEQEKSIRASALAVHRALMLGAYSRVDFILSSADGCFYCLEANTLPGMTPMSLLPQEAAADGIPYDELCRMLASTAEKKQPYGK